MLPESIDVSTFSPLLYVQRLHEAESLLREKEKENAALIAENAMLKVEVENLKQLLPKKTNPFAGSESATVPKTNPFAGSESASVPKTNPFAGSESETVPKTNPFSQNAYDTERVLPIRKKTNPFADVTETNETPETNELQPATEAPKPKLPPIHRRTRAHKVSAPKPAKQPTKPDEWAMSPSTESSFLQQYASLCDGDNGVHVNTIQEEFENLGLDEATGNEM